MTIDEAYKIVSYLVDKYQGTYIAPDDFNMIINMAQDQYIESIIDGTGNINSNNRKSPTGLMVNSSVSDKLSKFYTEVSANASPSGIIAKPSDSWTITSIRTSSNRPVKKVFDDNLATHLTNPIDAPTTVDPIYMETGINVRIFPSVALPTVLSYILGYIRTPNDMIWAYYDDLVHLPQGATLPSGKVLIPTGGSKNPEWGDADMNEIIYIAVGLIGINLKDVDLIRASQTIKNEGQ
jgi:hypothetical protein